MHSPLLPLTLSCTRPLLLHLASSASPPPPRLLRLVSSASPPPPRLHQYVIYSIINTIQAVTTLGLILPPLFFFAKTVSTLCCAYYVFKIEKGTSGATMLKEPPSSSVEVI